MIKKCHSQLELPVLVDVKSKQSASISRGSVTESVLPQGITTANAYFHKPASVDDQLIYKAISDNYFGISSKQD